jgi:uncharacterized protein YdhG (YjbR/CyaY superfamily)
MTETENPIDAHLARLPQPQRDTLAALRAILRELLPDAVECISYNMPCFKVDGVAVAGFEGFAKHCSYFPHSGNIVPQITQLPAWCTASTKGTLQFPVDRPLPKTVVRALVRARLAEIAQKTAEKAERKTARTAARRTAPKTTGRAPTTTRRG